MHRRILLISDNKIFGFGGGSIENRKYYMALKSYCEQHGDIFRVISMDTELQNALPVYIHKNKQRDMMVRLQGHSSFLYHVWQENKSTILEYKPDLVVLGRSRIGFIAKEIKQKIPGCKVIANVDNVELDYVDAYFTDQKGLKGKLKKALEKRVVYRDERDCINYSDQLVFLTKRNVQRYAEVYHYFDTKPVIIPICIEHEIALSIRDNQRNVVFIGSLDYAANVKAVKQLLMDIWRPYFSNRDDVRLIIAGRNPTQEIQRLVAQNTNVKMTGNFESLQSLVPIGSLMVAPIERGAGMKVKVAETLGMGLPIAASDEALVGYEKALERDQMNGILRCNTVEEYKNAILNYCSMTEGNLEMISMQNKRLYQELYSYDISREAISNLCDSMLMEK